MERKVYTFRHHRSARQSGDFSAVQFESRESSVSLVNHHYTIPKRTVLSIHNPLRRSEKSWREEEEEELDPGDAFGDSVRSIKSSETCQYF